MDNPFTMSDESSADNQTIETSENISYNDIACKLLRDRFYLSALELHTELIESGKEIQKLKEFFSNPGNFESQASRQDVCHIGLPRSSSQATLDSLDMTRYSEDGERGVDERVAVLEFELRKAKETITALRANLTVATECETPTADGDGNFKPLHCEPIKPHEQRALNFLLNEYLLLHGYKLTSITFADENEDQDFEDWDDVGLNIPKPAELLQLYRDAIRQPGHAYFSLQDGCAQTEALPDVSLEYQKQIDIMVLEKEHLKEKITILENEKKDLTANIERLTCVEPVTTHFAMPPPSTETVSVHRSTPECFEIIEPSPAPTSRHTSECGSGVDRGGLRDDTSSLNDPDWTRVNAFNDSETGSGIETEASREDPNEADVDSPPMDVLSHVVNSNRSLPPMFQKEVVTRCFIQTSKLHEIPLLHEIFSEGITQQRLVHILVQCLPRIIPNVVVNKREEFIPLLICTIHLHDEPSERETLLHWLFNLKKRPQEDERRCILAGVVGLARVSSQALIESELLPQCWEQISHRHVERRLLVAEACSALAPYISAGLRNSLLLSILQQLLVEDREDVVRLSCIKSLALIVAVMADSDKYSQSEELTMSALQDPSTTVVELTVSTLLPVLAKWSLDLGRLQSHLFNRMLSLLGTLLKRGMESLGSSLGRPASLHQASMVLSALRSLLPFLVMSIASVDCVLARIEPGLPLAEPRTGFVDLCRGLSNPVVFYDGEHSVGVVMGVFDVYVKEAEWPELMWIVETMIPRMLDCLEIIDITHEDLLSGFISFFKSLTAGFGKTVTLEKVKPVFLERLQRLESALATIGNEWPSFAVIPVYLLAIIAPLHQYESAEVGSTLRRFLFALSLSSAPLDCLQISVTHLSKIHALHETMMAALWEGVVHPRHVVRCATARLFSYAISNVGESMTTNRIVPALITLANDPEISVKTATIPVFGSLIINSTNKEVEDKTYFQIQNFLSDPAARDNHPTLLQLVITLGKIVAHSDSWFRDEVIIPQLAATAAFTQQLTNQTRRLDLAAALVDAFSNTVYCSLSKNTIITALLPGLKHLEQVCLQSLPEHQETVVSMIKEAESRTELPKPMERSGSSLTLSMATSNVGQGVEDMKNRVSKIFQSPMTRPTNLPNLQSIFRKK